MSGFTQAEAVTEAAWLIAAHSLVVASVLIAMAFFLLSIWANSWNLSAYAVGTVFVSLVTGIVAILLDAGLRPLSELSGTVIGFVGSMPPGFDGGPDKKGGKGMEGKQP